jgi:Flp pilus assembly pilin Flp
MTGMVLRVLTRFLRFLEDDRGQDLIEYTLLMAFVCLSCAVIFSDAGSSVSSIWKSANKTLSNAVVDAS